MSDLAERFRREGQADAVVLLVARRVCPTMDTEDWARALGLTQPDIRAAIARFRDRNTPPEVLARRREWQGRRHAGRPMASLESRRERDALVRSMAARGASRAEIAVAVGLTPSRIRQILVAG